MDSVMSFSNDCSGSIAALSMADVGVPQFEEPRPRRPAAAVQQLGGQDMPKAEAEPPRRLTAGTWGWAAVLMVLATSGAGLLLAKLRSRSGRTEETANMSGDGTGTDDDHSDEGDSVPGEGSPPSPIMWNNPYAQQDKQEEDGQSDISSVATDSPFPSSRAVKHDGIHRNVEHLARAED